MISHIDHIVITTNDIEASTNFYTQILGMKLQTFNGNRRAFLFGKQKINVHEYGKEIEPKAHLPVPGSVDICLITTLGVDEIQAHFDKLSVSVLEGPVKRTGACGPITSFYLRDPDLNLIEISIYEVSTPIKY
ncbi:VOC family protein [Escherichia coli]|uniref:VOC family protein n=1 Tax=Escherichia coli TaxID=562 RepID=UPI00058A0FFF|nr:VOC family protein [Escherichia coli]EFC4873637.1 VOC family protein [Escherichia coli]EJJ0330283.1 VOC family protein [Escherichia coli]EKY5128812.1 VOC family protein [Escherichia coli]KIH32622.1 hypothetical protein PU13_02455 [Escherichia coli]SQL83522.1 Virulence protein STM3117 [Escherichia coli]